MLDTKHPSIQTASGGYFDFLNPEASQVNIFDIASALSKICRYNGHCREFYSVAQHSVHVSQLVPAEHRFQALMHDAAEAYIGDITSPLKMLLPDYKVIEERVELAVLGAFQLSHQLSPEVKRADMVMLATEARDLLVGDDWKTWGCLQGIEPRQDSVIAWGSEGAKNFFLEAFFDLQREHLDRLAAAKA